MEPYQFGMTIGYDQNINSSDLDNAWNELDDSFGKCFNSSFNGVETQCKKLENNINDYFKKYQDLNSKLEGSNELSGQYKELNDKALMRPINISFGIMILLVLISDLTVGFE